ncbi:MAG: hypothetical protein C0168_10040 [Candidatus Aminicenantes bacterium]|nr:MAG: hypothetical protein C0168_10040 [Candidatus Aminicenantes bacterium]
MSRLSLWIDESERKGLLAVGGVLAQWSEIPSIVEAWRDMKEKADLARDTEVKWNLSPDHPMRKQLESSGLNTRDFAEKAVQFLVSSRMFFIVAVMFEQRKMSLWKSVWPKASVRDFYCEGLKYVVQRAAEEVAETRTDGCVVVCDTPDKIRRGHRAVHEAFAEWYEQGVGVGPGKQQYSSPLKDIGFHPTILLGDASFHDMLQMADVVVGLTGDWVASIKDGKSNPWVTQQFKALSSTFRSKYGQPSFWGDGLVLWPWQKDLWESLKADLGE